MKCKQGGPNGRGVYVLVQVVPYAESQVLGVYASWDVAVAEAERRQESVSPSVARYVVQAHRLQ